MSKFQYNEISILSMNQLCEVCKNDILSGFAEFEQCNSSMQDSCSSSAVTHVVNQITPIKNIYLENVTRQILNIQNYLSNFVAVNHAENESINLNNSWSFDINPKSTRRNIERFK